MKVWDKETFVENLATRSRSRWGEVHTVLVLTKEHQTAQLPSVVVVLREGVEFRPRNLSEELKAPVELCVDRHT